MASSIEDILYAKALADQQARPDPAVAMGGGAVAGSALGMLAGRGLRGRMAGGLLGAVLGGGLGAGVRQAMVSESPAANMLAKLQSQGQLDSMGKVQLQNILKDVYNNGGL
jgi:outer membrane lipoprotein SlyB